MNQSNVQNNNSQRVLDILQNSFQIMNTDKSSDEDIQFAQCLNDQYYKYFNITEQQEQDIRQNKIKCISEINQILQDYCQNYLNQYQNNKNVQMVDNSINDKLICIELFEFGSFYLEVDFPDSDIDLVGIFSNVFDAENHFSEKIPQYLKYNKNVQFLRVIRNTFLPLIKFQYKTINFDLLLVGIGDSLQVNNRFYLDNDIKQMIIEQGIEKKHQLTKNYQYQVSLNGVRNSHQILKLVKDHQNYKKTLKMIRFWAKQKGIYSGLLGYLGGIQYAIMVAKICQMYPNLECGKLVEKFFRIYSQWDIRMPICINERLKNDFNSNESQKSHDDSKMMFIYAPVDYNYNVAQNVNYSNIQITFNYINLAIYYIDQIKYQKSQKFDKLLGPFDFFNNYKYFIRIDIIGKQEYSEFLEFQGLIESKLKRFTKIFEKYNENHLKMIKLSVQLWPICDQFESGNEFHSVYYYGIKPSQKGFLNFKQLVDQFRLENMGDLDEYYNCEVNIFPMTREQVNQSRMVNNSNEQNIKQSDEIVKQEQQEQEQIPKVVEIKNEQVMNQMNHGLKQNMIMIIIAIVFYYIIYQTIF